MCHVILKISINIHFKLESKVMFWMFLASIIFGVVFSLIYPTFVGPPKLIVVWIHGEALTTSHANVTL